MKMRAASCVAALAAAACVLLWRHPAPDTTDAPGAAPAHKPAQLAATLLARHADSPRACVNKTPPLVPPTRLRESKMQGEEVDKLFALGFTQPERLLLRLAAPDDVTAMAAFKLVRNCFPARAPWSPPPTDPNAIVDSRMTGCPALPAWLVHGAPVILKTAADRGSPDAMFEYAMDMGARATGYARDDEAEGTARAQALLREAEAYGRQAAQHGLIDAYMFMSRAHETGQFGTRDTEAAYAYALPLAGHPEYGPYDEHLAELARRMTPAQIENARTRAYGCAAPGAGNALRNPFG